MVAISPPKYYEVNGEVTPIRSARVVSGAVANVSIVAAITGKRVRVMGFIGNANSAAASGFFFLDGSGGTALTHVIPLPLYPSTLTQLPIHEGGYFETSTGVGLFATFDAGGGAITVFYIAYTP